MKKYILMLGLLLFSAILAAAPKELFKEVNANKAARLAEYNAVFLDEVLYLSSRYRIVKVDTKLLLEAGSEFTITPFDDVETIPIKTDKILDTYEDFGYWKGKKPRSRYVKVEVIDSEMPIEQIIDAISSISFYMESWDVDNESVSSRSYRNKYEFSKHWEIDETGSPILPEPKKGESGIVGPPPASPEEIEHHRKMKKLKQRDFYSVSGSFYAIDFNSGGVRKNYVLMPLKYSPKYSVIYEVDPSKTYARAPWCDVPGEPCVDYRTELDITLGREHQAFLDNLPKEDKTVLGEIQ